MGTDSSVLLGTPLTCFAGFVSSRQDGPCNISTMLRFFPAVCTGTTVDVADNLNVWPATDFDAFILVVERALVPFSLTLTLSSMMASADFALLVRRRVRSRKSL